GRSGAGAQGGAAVVVLASQALVCRINSMGAQEVLDVLRIEHDSSPTTFVVRQTTLAKPSAQRRRRDAQPFGGLRDRQPFGQILIHHDVSYALKDVLPTSVGHFS